MRGTTGSASASRIAIATRTGRVPQAPRPPTPRTNRTTRTSRTRTPRPASILPTLGGVSMLNKCMIIGNLGADPEMRYTANGNAVTTFRVATTRSFSGADGERREETEWFSIVTWARLAETCAHYLTKGRQVYVEGRM